MSACVPGSLVIGLDSRVACGTCFILCVLGHVSSDRCDVSWYGGPYSSVDPIETDGLAQDSGKCRALAMELL